MYFVTFKPKIWGFLNYWKKNKTDQGRLIRDSVILLFGVAIMYGIFYGILWVLGKGEEGKSYVYFHPFLIFGLIFLYLFLMLIFSNMSSVISIFYSSNDLDLILSSPIKSFRFFCGKFLEALFESSWITMIFIFPMVYSVAKFYQAKPIYYFSVFFLLLPYLIIPTALAFILSTLYLAFVSPALSRVLSRIVFMLFVFGAIWALYYLFFKEQYFSFKNPNDILKILAIFSLPNVTYLPSFWLAKILSKSLLGNMYFIWQYVFLLFSAALSLFSFSFILFHLVYFSAYSRIQELRSKKMFDSINSQKFYKKALFFVKQTKRGMFAKEFKTLSRDSSQIMQALLLAVICILYFYNFHFLNGLQQQLPLDSRGWWQKFIFLINSYIETFLITAVGTRFVFQSVSLEGTSFWLLQTAPLSLKNFLLAKFQFWLLLVSTIMGFIFGLGSFLSGASYLMIILKLISCFIISYGVVGLGIGLGAYYAKFDWEHTSQLIASFGSLVYMLCSVVLVTVDLAIITLMLAFQSLMDKNVSTQLPILAIFSSFFLLLFLNIKVKRRALRIGVNELERRKV